MTHDDAVSEALLTVSRMGHRAFRREVGHFRDLRSDKVHSIGTKGEADVQGIIRPGGWALAIEVKTGNAVRSARQIKWGRMWLLMGGCYVVARWNDSSDGATAIKAAIEEYLSTKLSPLDF